MPDERQDSIRQGINAPEESPAGMAAAEERRKRAAEGPPIGGAMGGTSDASRPGDEAQMNAARHDTGAEDVDPDALEERSRILEETREASMRARGGGSSDEEDIDRTARENG